MCNCECYLIQRIIPEMNMAAAQTGSNTISVHRTLVALAAKFMRVWSDVINI